MTRFQEPGVRVKISHGLVQVLPSLRAFSVRQQANEVWTIDGNTVTTANEAMVLRTGTERPAGRPATIEARLSASNLVAATALIAWAKPGTVRITAVAAPKAPVEISQLDFFSEIDPVGTEVELPDADTGIVAEVTRQFFVACGYEQTEAGVFRR